MASSPTQADNTDSGESADMPPFEEIFVNHYSKIVGILHRLVGDRTSAEDLANEVFLKLYRRPLLSHSDGNIGGWLYRTASNLGIDALRARARRKQYESGAAQAKIDRQGQTDPLDGVLRHEERSRVGAVLAAIKPVQARLLVLRSQGFSYKEIADCLGAKPGSIGTALLRAENEFRKVYIRLYGDKGEL